MDFITALIKLPSALLELAAAFREFLQEFKDFRRDRILSRTHESIDAYKNAQTSEDIVKAGEKFQDSQS